MNKKQASILANDLVTMQKISWQEAMSQPQSLLRLVSPQEPVLSALKAHFSLDDLHIKDIYNPIHPPYLSHLDHDALHIILRFPVDRKGRDSAKEVTSVSVLADESLCVLIWPQERYHYFSDQELMRLSVDECVSKIIHMLVDFLLQRVYSLREEMDEFENECLEQVEDADLGKLLMMRKEMAALARYARTNAMVIEQLMAVPKFRENLRLTDAHEHMHRATGIAEAKAEHALNVMQAAQSLLSQRLNEVMTFLAVITVVLTPMGLIAGIFGMNFTSMDILAYPNGFALSVWGMLLLGAILAAFFKFKKWW